jgi:septal ring factor EnvC (AmiA/AmiB activator)
LQQAESVEQLEAIESELARARAELTTASEEARTLEKKLKALQV